MMVLVIGLTALALVAAGATLWISQLRRIDATITQHLEHANAEFVAFVEAAAHPATGKAYHSTEELLRAAIRYQLPGEHETTLAVLDGATRFSLGRKLTETDPELLTAVAAAPTDRVRISSLKTASAEYRWLISPVMVGDGPAGGLVVAIDRDAMRAPATAMLWTFLAISAAALALISVLGWLLLGRLLRPVAEMRRLSTEIANSDFSRRLPVRGNDDLAQLSQSFNTMVDHVTSVFASQRQLLDDAGHELRTPITIVSGHVELMDPHDPEDVVATQNLALSELDRMHRLTEDLVLLARSETPDLLRFREVDLGDLTATVFEHAQHLGEREWRLENDAHRTIKADPDRLTQAWLQLAANAVKFSEPGTPITISSREDERWVCLAVADRGRGIPVEDRERIFERFAQAGEPRGGSGLGLTIVQAIAKGHGGDVSVASSMGLGSTFTIRIPKRDPQGGRQ